MGKNNVETKIFSNGKLEIPKEYNSHLNLRETEKGIKFIKDFFQTHLAEELNFTRVSAPLFVLSRTGMNDHLNGVEKPISFAIKDINDKAEIVQSLAKWKRAALADYGFGPGEGLYTDMNAIRPDEYLDNLHSIYVDQWDWERIVSKEERNLGFLKYIVRKIYNVIKMTENEVCHKYNEILASCLPEEIHFVHSEELEEKYPDLTPREREHAICKEMGAVFVIGIGANLKNGEPHDGRAADYDDWITPTGENTKGLNGDIIVWYPLLDCALELSSMGIRVDQESLMKQLEIKDELYKKDLEFHKRLLCGELPLTIGGGIGQSRLCMFFLRKAHVGEVQSSIWHTEIREVCKENNIFLL